MTRYPGSIIRATPLVPTTTSASGVWTLAEVLHAQDQGIWPGTGLITAVNTANPAADSTDTGTQYTFSSTAIGSDGTNRVTVIAVAFGGDSTFPNVSSMTVAGNSCALAHASSIGSGENSAAEDYTSEIWDVSGLTETGNQSIVVNLSAVMGADHIIGISVWNLTGANSTAYDGAGAGVDDATTQLTLDMNTVDGGFIIGAASSFRNTVTSHSWTGITEVGSELSENHARLSFAGNIVSGTSSPASIDVQANVTTGWAFGGAGASYQPA